MTDNDDHLDQQLKANFDGIEIPPPDPAAKRRARAVGRGGVEAVARRGAPATSATERAGPETGALEGATVDNGEKIEKSSQGFLAWLRLIVGNPPDKEKAMTTFNQKFMYSGVAAAAVAAIAVGVSLQYPPASDLPKAWVPSEGELQVGGREGKSTLAEHAGRAVDDARNAIVETFQTREEAVTGQREVVQGEPAGAPASADAREDLFADSDMAASPSKARTRMAEADAIAPTAQMPPAAEARRIQAGAVSESALFAPEEPIPAPGYRDVGRDDFEAFEENPVKLVSEDPVSTFSVDVDTASYSFVRRMLNQGVLPQRDAVRTEEMINYFDYAYALPESRRAPFAPTVAVSDAPWAEGRKLMHIGIKGFDIPAQAKPRSNLVFLLDVSGSMNSPDKLPLVKQSMELLLTTLRPDDTVAIAVYAGAAGTVLEPTPVKDKQKILDALRTLSAGGSTAGAQGIRLAYELAESQFDGSAINRVILATDGDFNVGITSRRELQSFIERKRERGIFLSVLGFGQGNYHDSVMQTLAQNGNGVAAYIDTLSEAQKVLVDEATSTLFPIAKDVKLQVEFNPATVAEYRLIGYETRRLNREDFNNDAVDAGDIGAGHTVTAIYEFTPVGSDARQIEESRYAPTMEKLDGKRDEYAFLRIRYKLPEENSSELITRPVTQRDAVDLGSEGVGREAGFATAVAGFAQILKGGKYTGAYSYDDVIALAQKTKGEDRYGYRTEFIQLVRRAKTAAAMQAR